MMNQALFDVVKNQLAGGVGESEVKEFLRRRGTDEDEIREIFDMLAPNAPTLSDIPVVEEKAVVPVEQPTVEPVASAVIPETSVAHGVEREVPPLQPSVPFATPSTKESLIVESVTTPQTVAPTTPPATVSMNLPQSENLPQDFRQEVSSGIVLPPISNRKRKIAIIGVLIGVATLLITGGIYAYSFYFASPDRVMDRMFSNLRDVRAVAFSSELVATTSGTQPLLSATSSAANPFAGMFAAQEGPVTFTVKASGVVDSLDEGNPRLSVSLAATMDKWPLGDFVVGAEYRNLDRKNYIKVNDVPDLGFFNLSFLKNKWFVAEDKEAKTQLGMPVGSSDTIIPAVTQEQREQLANAWKENRFLTVSERLSSETIDGVSTHHYKLTFDKDAFKTWVVKADAILQNAPTDQRELNEGLDLLTINTMEIWIGKRDALPHKIFMRASLRDKDDLGKLSDVTFTFFGKDYNKAADIAAPEGAKSIEEALQGVFGQMLGAGKPATVPATPQERNMQRKSNVAAIADAIKQNIEDNKGTFVCAAGPLPQKATFLSRAGFGATGYVIEPCIVPMYLSELPKDPTKGTAASSGYSMFYDPKTKKITVRAPYAELGTKISITK